MFTDPSSQNSAAAAALRKQARGNKISKPPNGKAGDGHTSRYGDNYPNNYKHGQLEELTVR